jgi:hypothetical protein
MKIACLFAIPRDFLFQQTCDTDWPFSGGGGNNNSDNDGVT